MPPPPPRPAAGRRKKGHGGDDDDNYGGGRFGPLQRPPDQEKLTDAELKEEIPRRLDTSDPLKSHNAVQWDYKEGSYLPYLDPSDCVFLITINSELLSKDGLDIKDAIGHGEALMEDDSDNEVAPGFERPVVVEETDTKRKMRGLPTEETAEEKEKKEEKKEKAAEPPPEAEEEAEEGGGGGDAPKGKLLNQFNFCERASQTTKIRFRSHPVQTEPPPQTIYKDLCNLWVIHDSYMADAANRPVPGKPGMEHVASGGGGGGGGDEQQNNEEGGEKRPAKETKKDKEAKFVERARVKMRKQSLIEGQAASDVAYLKSAETLHFLERIIGVNIFDDVLYDFKYFEDSSDAYRDDGEGTALPLWRFLYDKAKKKHVTCISWSTSEPDIFAVSYGSFSFMHPVQTGFVVIYSIRNPLYPEHIWYRNQGALCCHIHEEMASLVCAGLADGNVIALNVGIEVQGEAQTEIYENLPLVLKHSAPVWSVKWGGEDLEGNPTFLSAGMDGKIFRWSIGLNDNDGNGGLNGVEIATLTLPQPAVDGPDGTSCKLFGCARCIVFHPVEMTTLLIGTAEGKIFISSSLYGNKVLKIFEAHFLPVANLQWNAYHSDIFISCSEDWTIKVWDRRDSKALFVFETGVPIMDVSWAPYSSSVFGGITMEGKLLVFDLNVCRESPVCTQQVATKKKIHPHRFAFNPKHPIVVIGDDRGSVLSLKLSPNLRVMPKDTRGIFLEGDVRINWELNKLIRIISLVRDPLIVTNPTAEELPLLTDLSEIPGQLSRLET